MNQERLRLSKNSSPLGFARFSPTHGLPVASITCSRFQRKTSWSLARWSFLQSVACTFSAAAALSQSSWNSSPSANSIADIGVAKTLGSRGTGTVLGNGNFFESPSTCMCKKAPGEFKAPTSTRHIASRFGLPTSKTSILVDWFPDNRTTRDCVAFFETSPTGSTPTVDEIRAKTSGPTLRSYRELGSKCSPWPVVTGEPEGPMLRGYDQAAAEGGIGPGAGGEG